MTTDCPITSRFRRRPSASPFLRPRPVDHPEVRFVAFHHAGGSASTYHALSRRLPQTWDVLLLDLPGRGRRTHEDAKARMTDLVDQISFDLDPWLGAPLALFGHSMGAILALEGARQLPQPPIWVGVSGRLAPSLQSVRPTRLHELSDDALLDVLIGMGGTPNELRFETELRTRFLATIRADLTAVASYRPDPHRDRLDCPISTFAGTEDPWAPPAAMAAWSRETAVGVEQHAFPGGHFYFLQDGLAELADRIVAELDAVIAGLDELPTAV